MCCFLQVLFKGGCCDAYRYAEQRGAGQQDEQGIDADGDCQVERPRDDG